jgi:deoxyribonuclease-4
MYSFVSTGEDAKKMIDALGSPLLKGLIDTANSHSVEGVEKAAQALSGELAHVQLSDTVRGELRHDALGKGDIDFVGAFEAVRAAGFAGPMTLELCEPDDPEGSLRQSVERLRQLDLI